MLAMGKRLAGADGLWVPCLLAAFATFLMATGVDTRLGHPVTGGVTARVPTGPGLRSLVSRTWRPLSGLRVRPPRQQGPLPGMWDTDRIERRGERMIRRLFTAAP